LLVNVIYLYNKIIYKSFSDKSFYQKSFLLNLTCLFR
jgi:hypothetical protein